MRQNKTITDFNEYGNNILAKAILKRNNLPWFHFYARFKANLNIREKRIILKQFNTVNK